MEEALDLSFDRLLMMMMIPKLPTKLSVLSTVRFISFVKLAEVWGQLQ